MPLIRIWVYDGILASSVAGFADVLTAANSILATRLPEPGSNRFRWRVESLEGSTVRSASDQMIVVDGRIDPRSTADAVIVPGPFVSDLERFLEKSSIISPMLAALRRQHERGVLLASYCTGSFLLAEAGLLDGGIATTHWAKGKAFARRYPDVELRIADIITEQEGIICSGAVTTSLNLALLIVEKFAGVGIAAETGKLMLIEPNRGSQRSYAARSVEHHSDPLVARAQRYMASSLQGGFDLGKLADRLSVSERTLNRRFKQAIGEPPLQYLQTLRVDVAKRLLESKRMPVESVGERVGYNDISTFRRLFKRETGLTPRDYRRRFSRQGAASQPAA
jgi:transcriptional regulator GlxA family with amidase domain